MTHASREDTPAPQPVSLIATIYNEEASVAAFFDGLRTWTRLPDEIVLVDGGSTDGTVAAVRARIADNPVPVRLIEETNCNIARGRNIAIANARHDLIAVTDLGCRVAPDWLERIVAPLESDPAMDVAGGYYDPVAGTPVQQCYANLLHKESLQAGRFIPSSRSLAFRRRAWDGVNGYPEHLATGEDTAFILAMRKQGIRETVVPDARVVWQTPAALGGFYRQALRYGRGAGAGRIQPLNYLFYALNFGALVAWIALALCAAPWFIALFLAQFTGYAAFRILRKPRARANLTPGNFVRYIGLIYAIDLGSLLGCLHGLIAPQRPFTPPTDRDAG